MEDDKTDPHQLGLYLLNIAQSSLVHLAGKALLLIFLLLFSAFLTGFEAIFDTSSGKKNNSGLTKLYNNITQIRGTISILQFFIKTVAGITFAEIVRQIFSINNQHIFYAIVLFSVFVMLVLGQWVVWFLPKNNEYQTKPFFAGMLVIFNSVLFPVSIALNSLKKYAKNILKKKGYLEKEKREGKGRYYETDFAKLAESFNQTTVKQVMRSRMDITTFNIDLNFHELLININKFGFSRIPVYRETIDKIEGILYMKDLLPYIGRNKDFPWQNLLRPPYFVPENKKIEELLREFQEKHVHMALVVDGYGGISGLLTLEDILEEIVGEINDELDEVDLNYIKLDSNTYIFEGKTSLNDFCKILDIDPEIFEDVKGESESLGGLLLQMNSNLPKKGDKIFYKNFVFRIDSANNKRIKKVKVEYLEEKEVKQDAES